MSGKKLEIDGVTYRRATLADHRAVTELSNDVNPYEGLDYLEYFFPKYISQGNRHCYLAEKNGKALAYMQNILVDGGLTAIGQAGRSAPDVQHKGIYKTLFAYFEREVNAMNPHYERVSYTAYLSDFQKKFLKKAIYKVVDTRFVRAYKMNTSPTTTIADNDSIQNIPVKEVKQINMQEMLEILCDLSTKQKLFPKDSFISLWMPFSTSIAIQSNIKQIYDDSTVYATFDKNGRCTSVISATIIHCPYGLRYDVNFYGTGGSADLQLLKAHILIQAKLAWDYSIEHNRKAIMKIFWPTEIPLEMVDDFALNVMGWDKGPFWQYPQYISAVADKEKAQVTTSKL
ncbi:unnamed protein product [Owenia fusiformis]|uniref:Uncharacterized protein n=1 Tax=Owenia fusiformis TaxID=6347 RepID=A0A8J1TA39_OWEFU|nr:unnamed protein product [Owenia fusiformis]